MQCVDLQLGGTTGILLVALADGIAFLLVVPLLIVIYRGTIVVEFVPILLIALFVWLSIVPLLQLSFQLVVSLSESFNYYG